MYVLLVLSDKNLFSVGSVEFLEEEPLNVLEHGRQNHHLSGSWQWGVGTVEGILNQTPLSAV